MSAPEPSRPQTPRTTTRLQDIALEYVERYWHRLHPADRLAFLAVKLTRQERQALLRLLEDEAAGERHG